MGSTTILSKLVHCKTNIINTLNQQRSMEHKNQTYTSVLPKRSPHTPSEDEQLMHGDVIVWGLFSHAPFLWVTLCRARGETPTAVVYATAQSFFLLVSTMQKINLKIAKNIICPQICCSLSSTVLINVYHRFYHLTYSAIHNIFFISIRVFGHISIFINVCFWVAYNSWVLEASSFYVIFLKRVS